MNIMANVKNINQIGKLIYDSVNSAYNSNGIILNEGVTYNNETDSFIFDFNHDNKNDIIELSKIGFKVDMFNHCYYYGYEFTPDIDSHLRTEFIHSLKFPDGKISDKDKHTFIRNAVNKLDKDISLPKYKLIIYPESISELNRDMLSYLNKLALPSIANIELIKELPAKIQFDYDRFNLEVLSAKLPNGKFKYTEKQKIEVLNNIQQLIDDIHKLNYFSIARNIKKTKYRQYIKNFYKFKNDTDKQLFEKIINTNVLIIDDISTSGSTLSLLLNCLRAINDSNNIVIFSLIGKNIF